MRGTLVKATIYDTFGEPDLYTLGTQNSGAVGTVYLPVDSLPYFRIYMQNWQPFGLSHFAAVLEGTMGVTEPGLYFQHFNIGGGYYRTQGFQLDFHIAYVDGTLESQDGTETMMAGEFPFQMYFQTDDDPTTAVDYLWVLPTPWGGDPSLSEDAHAYLVSVPDSSSTAGLVGIALLGALLSRRKIGRRDSCKCG